MLPCQLTKPMKVLISHPTSNECNRAAVYGLYEENMLAQFHTAVASFPGSFLDSMSTLGAFSAISRRRLKSALKPHTTTWPWMELGRQMALKAGLKELIHHETGLLSVDAVYRNFDKKVALALPLAQQKGATAVYAYLDAAFYTFQQAKILNLACLYDLPIGYWRKAREILQLERERWPDWAPTLTSLMDSPEKLARQDEELRMADRIFVASRFTAHTLKDFPSALAPVEILPFGFPPAIAQRDYNVSMTEKKPLKLLFVGGLSQRKGIANLFAAVQGLERYIDLTIVGLKDSNHCPTLDAALQKHLWIPTLPHAEVLELMRKNDVLIFPSLFEGFGLVITEAMSQGMPVITTDRTAGPDLIEHGRNGWLIQAGSTTAIREALEELLSKPKAVIEAGHEAIETAKKRPWSVYQKELTTLIATPHVYR